MDNKRILELALEALEKHRAAVEAAIEEIRTEFMGGIGGGKVRKPETATLVVVKRRSKTAAEKKAQSERMKAYWAAKRAQAGKGAAAGKPTPASSKRRSAF